MSVDNRAFWAYVQPSERPDIPFTDTEDEDDSEEEGDDYEEMEVVDEES